MTLDEFKDVYSGKTPVEKLRLMVDQFDNWRNDTKHRVDANWRGNFDEAAYYASECEAMKDRVKWLYDEISNVLKAQEPRLLTMEEVNNLPSCHVVIELNERYGGFLHWIDGLLFCRNIDGSTDFITLCGKTRLPREEYGKKWRCWDKYILGAQGEAKPWE